MQHSDFSQFKIIPTQMHAVMSCLKGPSGTVDPPFCKVASNLGSERGQGWHFLFCFFSMSCFRWFCCFLLRRTSSVLSLHLLVFHWKTVLQHQVCSLQLKKEKKRNVRIFFCPVDISAFVSLFSRSLGVPHINIHAVLIT